MESHELFCFPGFFAINSISENKFFRMHGIPEIQFNGLTTVITYISIRYAVARPGHLPVRELDIARN